jgi:hypothetical protein
MLRPCVAIGYSTYLVARDSNLIVVRGGDEGQPQIMDQMRDAVDQFFPEAGIIESMQAKGFEIPQADKAHERSTIRRSISGASDLLGVGNGDRPGGFVLVIDGAALGNVSLHIMRCIHCDCED